MFPRDPTGNIFFAAATLAAGVGTAAGFVLIAKGRANDVYPWAAAVTLAGAVVAAAYTLGGDEPPRLVRR